MPAPELTPEQEACEHEVDDPKGARVTFDGKEPFRLSRCSWCGLPVYQHGEILFDGPWTYDESEHGNG